MHPAVLAGQLVELDALTSGTSYQYNTTVMKWLNSVEVVTPDFLNEKYVL